MPRNFSIYEGKTSASRFGRRTEANSYATPSRTSVRKGKSSRKPASSTSSIRSSKGSASFSLSGLRYAVKKSRPSFCTSKTARKAQSARKAKKNGSRKIQRSYVCSTPLDTFENTFCDNDTPLDTFENTFCDNEQKKIVTMSKHESKGEESRIIEEALRSILEKVEREEDSDDRTDDEEIIQDFLLHQKCNRRCRVRYIVKKKKEDILFPNNMDEMLEGLYYIQRNPEDFSVADVKAMKAIFLEWGVEREDVLQKFYREMINARSAIRGTSDTEEDSDKEEDSNSSEDNEEENDSGEDNQDKEENASFIDDSEEFIDFGENNADFYLCKYNRFGNECNLCGKIILPEDTVLEESDYEILCDCHE